MPQPFKRRSDQEVIISPDAILQRPNFAALIALVAGYWSRLEHVFGMPFAFLLAGNEPTALACYHSVFELGLRKQLFISAANTRYLPQELIDEYNKLHTEIRKIAKNRNAIVHGLWGICETRKDSILLCEPNSFTKMVFDAQSIHNENINQSKTPQRTVARIDEFIEYKENDFKEILDVISKQTNAAQAYLVKIVDFSISTQKETK